MKKLVLTFALIIGFTVVSKAQTAVKVEPANSTSVQPATVVNTTASETPVSTTETKPTTEKKCAAQKSCCKTKAEGTTSGNASCAKKEEKACCKKKTEAKKD